MQEIKPFGAKLYNGLEAQVMLKEPRDIAALFATIADEGLNLNEAKPVAAVVDEYRYVCGTDCVCGGEYGIRPLTRGQVGYLSNGLMYEVLATQCMMCGQERNFIFDITTICGKPWPADHHEKMRVIYSLSMLHLAKKADQVFFTYNGQREKASDFYPKLESLLFQLADHHPEVFMSPLNLELIKNTFIEKFSKDGLELPEEVAISLDDDIKKTIVRSVLEDSLPSAVPVVDLPVLRPEYRKLQMELATELKPAKLAEKEKIHIKLRCLDAIIKLGEVINSLRKEMPTEKTRKDFVFVQVNGNDVDKATKWPSARKMDDGSVVIPFHREILMFRDAQNEDLVSALQPLLVRSKWIDKKEIERTLIPALTAMTIKRQEQKSAGKTGGAD